MSNAACPTADTLHALLAGKLARPEEDALARHLDGCEPCQRALDRLTAPSGDFAAVSAEEDVSGPGLRRVLQQARGGADPDRTRAETPAADDSLDFLDPPREPGHLGRLGHYEVLEVVGRGGFGVVLKAFDERLQRVVAVKVLSPALAGSGSARKRFLREAKAAAAVSHDHVVPIYHVDEARGVSFLVMPLIPGKSLQDRIEHGGPLELKEILRIGMQAAEGLAAAHKQGLVHRDIKPANILLENGVERVKITDFGLARAIDDASVTQSGVISGTPLYMSPEQARGEYVVDRRSDLFSLGSVLYTMCTGRAPFRASGVHAVLRRVIEDTPRPIREVNPDVPDWLEAIVGKLLAKEPAARFQSASEVAELLRQHLAHLQEPKRVPRPADVAPVPGKPAGVAVEKLLDATDTRKRLVQNGCVLLGLVIVIGAGLMDLGLIPILIGAGLLVVAARVRQRWEQVYRGHRIGFRNGVFTGERLYIDGKRVGRGGFGRRRELRGVIRTGDGAGDEIMALVEAGLLSFRCRIYAEHTGPAAAAPPPAPTAAPPRTFREKLVLALAVGLPVLAGILVVVLVLVARRSAQLAELAQRNRAGVFPSPLTTPAGRIDRPQDALDRLVGTWRAELVLREPPDAGPGRSAGFVRYEKVAGGRFLREFLWNDDAEFEAVRLQTFDEGSGQLRNWFFSSDGMAWAPGSGVWDAAAQSLTWLDTLPDGIRSVNELRFAGLDRIDARWIHQDPQGKLTFDLRTTLTRVKDVRTVVYTPMPTDPKRPAGLKSLDRLAGDWREETLTTVGDPPEEIKSQADCVVRPVLAGNFLERRATSQPVGLDEYSLLGFDRAAGKYREWRFVPAGSVAESEGAAKGPAGDTIEWRSRDGLRVGSWHWRSADQRDFQSTVKLAGGRVLYESRGTAKRTAAQPGPAARPD
jgi:serine/threonine-protein kinase